MAAREADAVVLTKDRDFVDLLERLGPPPRVLWLTCGNTSNSRLFSILQDAWPRAVALLGLDEPLVEVSDRP
jgi:predicted nuclease of predicted toxin-antitoxin system